MNANNLTTESDWLFRLFCAIFNFLTVKEHWVEDTRWFYMGMCISALYIMETMVQSESQINRVNKIYNQGI